MENSNSQPSECSGECSALNILIGTLYNSERALQTHSTHAFMHACTSVLLRADEKDGKWDVLRACSSPAEMTSNLLKDWRLGNWILNEFFFPSCESLFPFPSSSLPSPSDSNRPVDRYFMLPADHRFEKEHRLLASLCDQLNLFFIPESVSALIIIRIN